MKLSNPKSPAIFLGFRFEASIKCKNPTTIQLVMENTEIEHHREAFSHHEMVDGDDSFLQKTKSFSGLKTVSDNINCSFDCNIGLDYARDPVVILCGHLYCWPCIFKWLHFVGDGGTTKGINENNTVINQDGLLSIHMPAYYNSIIKGVLTVMVSYSSWNGKKMHANRDLITGFLKERLRFRGFVISDWQGIDRITSPPHSNYSYDVSAGVNMIMVPYNHTEFIDTLTDLFKKNEVPISRIDDAVRRILRIKFTMGLFENPMADLTLTDQLGSQVRNNNQYSLYWLVYWLRSWIKKL